jgi:hypothetical protein
VTAAAASPWSPLRSALFRSLWLATIVSNVGTWMQDVGAGWLMTSLSSSPSMVALVEAAGSLPVMLLAMPAGAVADIVDRRRLLLGIQVYFLVVISALAVLTALDNSADPSLYVEIFMDESWTEHLRQHERASVADREIQARAKRYLVPGTDTKSEHWLADREP